MNENLSVVREGGVRDIGECITFLLQSGGDQARLAVINLLDDLSKGVKQMPIEYVSGDLFVNRFEAQAFAHGCNCQGAMGAGIAKGFRERYPRMYEEYHRLCKTRPRLFNMGDCFLWKEEGKPGVFNLGTQEGFWRVCANYGALEVALERMKQQADEQAIRTIAIPRIGAGHGGLSWRKIRTIIERVFGDWTGTLYVYEEYTPCREG